MPELPAKITNVRVNDAAFSLAAYPHAVIQLISSHRPIAMLDQILEEFELTAWQNYWFPINADVAILEVNNQAAVCVPPKWRLTAQRSTRDDRSDFFCRWIGGRSWANGHSGSQIHWAPPISGGWPVEFSDHQRDGRSRGATLQSVTELRRANDTELGVHDYQVERVRLELT
jgi:hypothetical protein